MGDAQSDELIGRTLGKKFLVRGRLGTGGMGAVYEAEHVITKRVGALKLLHPSVAQNAGAVARFLREASAAGRIADPHIVETIDAGELISGEPYIFMERLDGVPVSELIKRRGRLSFAEAREIVLQAAAGLAAAHANGIVHRDVKPANLFLCRGEPVSVKLLDFGISKFASSGELQLTADGAPMGTPYYMSPEQVAGKSDIGPSSDIYSLGVVLYECVTGKVPFDAETLPALSIKIFEGSYAPPSSLSESRVAGLDEVIARAMATAPSKRYATMSELYRALEALDPGRPASLGETLRTATEPGSVPSESRPPNGTGSDSLAPPTVTSPATRHQRKAWGAAVALGLGLGLAGIVALTSPPRTAPVAGDLEPAQPSHVERPAPPSAGSDATPSASALILPVSAAPPIAASHAAPPPRAGARSSLPRVSKAARDGLSEQNPFEP
jgi:serine/threonine-protein kinase